MKTKALDLTEVRETYKKLPQFTTGKTAEAVIVKLFWNETSFTLGVQYWPVANIATKTPVPNRYSYHVEFVSTLFAPEPVSTLSSSPEGWILKATRPQNGVTVDVKLDSGRETQGFIDENANRTTWMVKGTGGQFWRAWGEQVVSWKPIKDSE